MMTPRSYLVLGMLWLAVTVLNVSRGETVDAIVSSIAAVTILAIAAVESVQRRRKDRR